MKLQQQLIDEFNQKHENLHQKKFNFLKDILSEQGVDVEAVVKRIMELQIAIPSWALGTGGTRFGRFPGGGEPRDLEEKIQDVGTLHALNKSSGAISLHIPWDIPANADATKKYAADYGIRFDAVNSNTFQDQQGQSLSYKFGSLSHYDKDIRKQAIDHNLEVIHYGKELGSDSITIWLSDGSNFPGQRDFKQVYQHTRNSLTTIYEGMPGDWKMFIEYKPYEPHFYSTVIQDWGTSYLLATDVGENAYTLVDLGHHLPNTNIEQIVATLLMKKKLGGFHFNDSKYGDDDLTVGSIKPYQLYLIFVELVDGILSNYPLSWMIDASHNSKDPLEDLLQSVEALKIAYAQALILNKKQLAAAQEANDPTLAQEIVQGSYRMDVRPLVAEARFRLRGALDPINCFRELRIRESLIEDRGVNTIATGL